MIEETKAWIEVELERLASARLELIRGDEEGGHAPPKDSRIRQVETRIRRLGLVVAALPNVDDGMLHRDRAGLGSEVIVSEGENGEEITYVLLAGPSIDVDAGEVSLGSPIGQSLLGAVPGDEVSVQTPRRIRKLVVRKVVTLAQMLDAPEIEPERASAMSSLVSAG